MKLFTIVCATMMLSLTAVSAVSAQTAPSATRGVLLPCPADSYPAAVRNQPNRIWGPQGAGVDPVIPEFIQQIRSGADPRQLLSRYARREFFAGETLEQQAAIVRGSQRLEMYWALRLANREVPLDQLALSDEDRRALRDLHRPDNLVEEVIPCGEIMPYLTSAAPDRYVNGIRTAQINIQRDMYVGWNEVGVRTPDGRPGVRAVCLKEGYKGVRFCVIENCGNPADLLVAPERVEVPAPAPVATPVTPNIRQFGGLRVMKTCVSSAGMEIPCPPQVRPIFTLTSTTQGGESFQRQAMPGDNGQLVVRFDTIPAGSYRLTEQAVPGFKVEYLDGQVFQISENTELVPRVRNVQEPEAVPQQPAQPARSRTRPRFAFTGGLEAAFGKVNSTYTESLANAGDVPQRNSFLDLRVKVRVEPIRGGGPFVAAKASVAGSTSNMEYQAIDGWNTKRRDTDTSRDKFVDIRGGWKFGLGSLSVGPFVGWHQFCSCEEYQAQGASTVTERKYQGMTIGGEASAGERTRFTASAFYAPNFKRKSFTQQTMPGINFPRADNPDRDGSALGLRVEVDRQIWKMIHADAGFEYLGIDSSRPNTFAADEKVGVKALTVGVSVRWGR